MEGVLSSQIMLVIFRGSTLVQDPARRPALALYQWVETFNLWSFPVYVQYLLQQNMHALFSFATRII
jgi:hypothetical protein